MQGLRSEPGAGHAGDDPVADPPAGGHPVFLADGRILALIAVVRMAGIEPAAFRSGAERRRCRIVACRLLNRPPDLE